MVIKHLLTGMILQVGIKHGLTYSGHGAVMGRQDLRILKIFNT